MNYQQKLNLLNEAVANNDAPTIERLMPAKEMDVRHLLEEAVVLGFVHA